MLVTPAWMSATIPGTDIFVCRKIALMRHKWLQDGIEKTNNNATGQGVSGTLRTDVQE
jgi:hypothetical protein